MRPGGSHEGPAGPRARRSEKTEQGAETTAGRDRARPRLGASAPGPAPGAPPRHASPPPGDPLGRREGLSDHIPGVEGLEPTRRGAQAKR